jgi:hypothetical protein
MNQGAIDVRASPYEGTVDRRLSSSPEANSFPIDHSFITGQLMLSPVPSIGSFAVAFTTW